MSNIKYFNIMEKEEMEKIISEKADQELFGLVKGIQISKNIKPLIPNGYKIIALTASEALNEFKKTKIKNKNELCYLAYFGENQEDFIKYIFGKCHKSLYNDYINNQK